MEDHGASADNISVYHRHRRKKLDGELIRRDGDDDKFSLITVTSTSLQESNGSTFVGSVYTKWEQKFACRALHKRGRVFSYRKRRTRVDNGMFSAPAGVSPHHVTSSIIRRKTGRTYDSQLVFVWPQKATTKGRLLSVFAPLLRSILLGLFLIDALHLWPGEFLPASLPLMMPIPLAPTKCNVIEPRWFDNN